MLKIRSFIPKLNTSNQTLLDGELFPPTQLGQILSLLSSQLWLLHRSFFKTIIIMFLFMRISRTHFSGLALFIISHINLSTVLLINLCSFFLLEKHWNFTLSTVDDFWIPRRISMYATSASIYILSSFLLVNDNVIPSIQVWSFPDFYSGGKIF